MGEMSILGGVTQPTIIHMFLLLSGCYSPFSNPCVSLQPMCRSPNLAKDDKLESETDPKKDISGRHFLFDKQCEDCRILAPPSENRFIYMFYVYYLEI